jgi:hypothetical protein
MASQTKQCGECGYAFVAEARELQVIDGELVDYYGNKFEALLVADYGTKFARFLFGNPVMVGGGTIRGWKSGILVSISDPKGYCMFDGSDIIIENGYNKQKDAGPNDVLCNVLIEDKMQQFSPSQLKQTQHKNKADIARAQSLDDLRQLAQQRGYKRGWAERVYQARLAKRYGG